MTYAKIIHTSSIEEDQVREMEAPRAHLLLLREQVQLLVLLTQGKIGYEANLLF